MSGALGSSWSTTAVEIGGRLTLGNQPKTKRSKRVIPIARSVSRRLDQHLSAHVDSDPDALVFTAPKGGPLFRGTFARDSWRPALKRAGLADITYHGLRHSFVAILV